MDQVYLELAQWQMVNKEPVAPTIRRVDGREAIKIFKLAIQRHKKQPQYLPAETRHAIEDEVYAESPLVPNLTDPDYVKALDRWTRAKDNAKYQAVLTNSIARGQEAVLALIMADTAQATLLYREILSASEITQSMVFAFIRAEERYYGDKPFLQVLSDRVAKQRTRKHPDTWHTKAMDTFTRHGLIGDALVMPIMSQCRLMANLFQHDWIQQWKHEDREVAT